VKPKPDEHDRALFREATRGVKPLRTPERVTAAAPKPRARPRFARAEQLPEFADGLHGLPDGPPLAPGDASVFARPGVAASTLRKLRRGQYRAQAQLDLHGLTVTEATLRLREFLSACLQHDTYCVRIVHGKGLRSGAKGPVLRQLVNNALRGTSRVLAFSSARPVDGGTGALYVLLDTAQASSAST
jgi:DNA-nicking Smr family endonuclease